MSTVEQLARSTGVDPTQTTQLRGRLAGRWRGAYGKINSQMQTDIVERDVFGLRSGQAQLAPTNERNTGGDYSPEALPSLAGLSLSEQVQRFREWLTRQQQQGIRGRLSRRHNPYLTDAYSTGIRRAEEALRDAGYSVTPIDPVNVSRRSQTLDEARGRFDERLTKAFQDTTAEAGMELREGLSRELAATPLVSALKDRVNHSRAGKTRARPVAHSAVVRVVNEAALDRYRDAGVDEVGAQVEQRVTVEGPMTDEPELARGGVQGSDEEVEWTTAGDSRVCEECMALAGERWTVAEYSRGGGVLPVRDTHQACRCFLRPV